MVAVLLTLQNVYRTILVLVMSMQTCHSTTNDEFVMGGAFTNLAHGTGTASYLLTHSRQDEQSLVCPTTTAVAAPGLSVSRSHSFHLDVCVSSAGGGFSSSFLYEWMDLISFSIWETDQGNRPFTSNL